MLLNNSIVSIINLKRIANNCCPFFITTILLLSLTISVKANYHFTENLNKSYDLLFQLKTPTARQLLKQEINKSPDNGIGIYLLNYTDVVECIVTGEEYRYVLLLEEYEKRLAIIEKLDDSSPYHLFVISEMKLQMAFTRLYFQDKTSAFWLLRSAYKQSRENIEKFPGFKPSRKTIGILEILIGSVPQEYQWITNISGFRGTTENGIKILNNVIEKDSIFKKEALLIKWLTQFHLLKEDPLQQLQNIDSFYNADRENLLVGFIYASMLTKQGRNDESLAVLNRIPEGNDYVNFNYINSMRADCFLYKGEYNKAIINYQQFLKHYNGKHYIKSANFKLSLAYWLLDNFTVSDKYRNKTINEGTADFDSDKKAYKYANKNIELNKTLLQAQLFYDGGYYDKTLSLLNNSDVGDYPNLNHKIEYFYRKGRTYQKIKFNNKAIRHFISVINLSTEDNDLYFAPNACLQLGYIFIDEQKYDSAKLYLKKASTYSGHEYESSINSAAKKALKSIPVK